MYIISKIDIGELHHGEHYYASRINENGVALVPGKEKVYPLNAEQYTTHEEQMKLYWDKFMKGAIEEMKQPVPLAVAS